MIISISVSRIAGYNSEGMSVQSSSEHTKALTTAGHLPLPAFDITFILSTWATSVFFFIVYFFFLMCLLNQVIGKKKTEPKVDRESKDNEYVQQRLNDILDSEEGRTVLDDDKSSSIQNDNDRSKMISDTDSDYSEDQDEQVQRILKEQIEKNQNHFAVL